SGRWVSTSDTRPMVPPAALADCGGWSVLGFSFISRRRRRASAWCQHEDGDLAFGLGLVIGVGRVGGNGPPPPAGPSVAGYLACAVVVGRRAALQFHMGFGDDVVVPDGMSGRAAQRGDNGVFTLVLGPHERGLTELSGLVADGGQHDNGHTVQGRTLGAARVLDLLGLFAGPIGRGRCVFSGQWHTTGNVGGSGYCSRPVRGGRTAGYVCGKTKVRWTEHWVHG